MRWLIVSACVASAFNIAPAQDVCAVQSDFGLAAWRMRAPDTTNELRIFISVARRTLWVLDTASDTLYAAPVAVGSHRTLVGPTRSWTFDTPRGIATVARKEQNPLWIPPDWHYIELARQHGLRFAQLRADHAVQLSGGTRLIVRDSLVGVVMADGDFAVLPADEEIVFDGVLFAPPFGTRNRLIPGVLGAYRLLLSNGVGLHGTPDQESIGKAVTHGCVRLRDADIEWLYANVPLGTRVIIYE